MVKWHFILPDHSKKQLSISHPMINGRNQALYLTYNLGVFITFRNTQQKFVGFRTVSRNASELTWVNVELTAPK